MCRFELFFSVILTTLVMAIPAVTHAFSKERCGRMFPQSDNDHPYYYSPIYISTMMPSTTSYFSSIGPCSMYGEYQGASRVSFVEEALPELRVDAARGGGDYIKTLAQLTGCPAAQYSAVADVMQRNFASVFRSSESKDTDSQIARIDAALRSDSSLVKTCTGLNETADLQAAASPTIFSSHPAKSSIQP